MRFNKALALFLAVTLLILLPGIAQAKKDFIITGVLFGDQVSATAWNRLELSVDNNTTKDFQGTVLVELEGEYFREVFVEAGKTASLTIYLPPMAYSMNPESINVILTLLDQGGKSVSHYTLSSGRPADTPIVGVMAREVRDFRRISGVLSYLSVKGMSPNSLDLFQFAQNFRAIIFCNPDAEILSPEQNANLRRWLESGGVLIIGGGSGWQQSAALLPADLLPVRVQGVETISAGDLASLALPSLEESEYTIAVGENLGEVLFSSAGGRPLLVAKKVGKGTILWSALDLESPPLLNAANAESFWQKLFLLKPVEKASTIDKRLTSQLLNTISQDSLASALSPGKVFLLLLGYIILVGPVNWLVLRKIDRREWAWFVIPAVALLLTAGSFVYGRLGRGSDAIVYQVNLIDKFSANQAYVESYCGILVPSTRNLTLSSDASLAPFSKEIGSRLKEGRQILALDSPPLWSVQNFIGAGILDTSSSMEVEIRFNGSVQRFEATVTNNSGQDLFASYIKVGQYWLELGPIHAGESKTSSTNIHPDFSSILSRYNMNYGGWLDFSSLGDRGNAQFLGFGDSGYLDIEEVSKTVALDIWVQEIENWDISAAGSVDIPQGILIPIVQGQELEDYGKNYHFYNREGDSVDLVFYLPENLDYSQGEYELNMGSIWGDIVGKMSVFNYHSQDWQEITSFPGGDMGFSKPMFLDNIEELVFENRLTVRIDYAGEINLSLEGIDISVTGGRIND